MKNKIFTLLNNKYFLSILGLIMISYYIWFRFIRARMPRNLPFDLTPMLLIIVVIICLIYIYSIYKAIKLYKILWYKNISSDSFNYIEILLPYITALIKPLLTFDNVVKQHILVKKNYKKALITISLWWESYITYVHNKLPDSIIHYKYDISNNILYFCWNIIPKIISLFILCVDIIYFNKLYYTYIFIYVSIIPLLCSYFYYSLKKTLEEYLIFLETWYQVKLIIPENDPEGDYIMNYDDWVEDPLENRLMPLVSIRQFLFYQTEHIMFRNKKLNYKCAITWDLVAKYNLDMFGKTLSEITQEQLFILEKDFNELMPLAIRLELLNHVHTYLFHNKISRFIYIIQCILNLLTLCCWLYILFVSFSMSNLFQILDSLNILYKYIPEPFSDMIISLNNRNLVEEVD